MIQSPHSIIHPAPPRFLVIDAHPVTLHGIRALLAHAWADSEVRLAEDFAHALEVLDRFPVDLIISEVRIGAFAVTDLLRKINSGMAPVRCLVFSACDEVQFGVPAMRAGASGYLMKNQPAEELVLAVRSLLAGRPYLSERLAHALVAGPVAGASLGNQLTRRETEVFTHLGHGLAVSQIAARLELSVKTVEAHRENIKSKLGLQNAAQVTAAAVRWLDQSVPSI